MRIFYLFLVSILFTFHSSGQITVNIINPTNYQVSGNTVFVSCSVTSVYELSSVVATSAGRSLFLTYNQSTKNFQGNLSLVGLPESDTFNIQVTATDIKNNTQQSSVRSYVHDLAPIITVESPLNETVARPRMRIRFTVTDFDLCAVTIRFQSTTLYSANVKGVVDTTIDLSSKNGSGAIVITASDRRGQTTSYTTGTVYVVNSPLLTELIAAGGRILDYKYNKVLSLGDSTSDRMTIVDLVSHTKTVLPFLSVFATKGFLTPYGAVIAQGDSVSATHLYDWNQGQVYPLGLLSSEFAAEGDYAIWVTYPGNYLYYRDLRNKTTSLIDSGVGNINMDVAANGLATYFKSTSGQYNVYTFQDGSSKTITSNEGNKWNTWPVTDGKNVVYRKHGPCCGTEFSLYLNDGQSNTELSNLGYYQYEGPSPSTTYQANNGYVAYLKPGTAGQKQVWLRDQSGNSRQLTFSGTGTDNNIRTLTSDGDVIISNPSGISIYFKNGQVIPLTVAGTIYYYDSTFYTAIGRSLFKLDLFGTDTHLAYAAATNTGSQAYGGSLGMEFTVNSPKGILIKQLGAFDHQGDGIKGDIRVAIFNQTTKQIVPGLDAIITGNADGYVSNYRVKNISAVTLLPGTYIIVAQGYNANELNGNSDLGTPIIQGDNGNGAITYTRSFFGPEGSFILPETWDGPAANKYLAGTFQFEVVSPNTATSHLAYKAATNIGSQAYGGSLGMEFTVNNPAGIQIKQLGAFDHQGDGINGNIRVAIFNTATKQIIPGLDVTITGATDEYSGNYRLKNISPVTLTPGTYVLVAQGYNANELNGNPDLGTPIVPGDSSNGAIGYTRSLFGPDGTFSYPETWDGPAPNKYVAGTFQFNVLPNIVKPSYFAYKAATSTGSQAYNGSLGMEFAVKASGGIVIKQLGVFDHQGDGIKGNIRVAIFDKTTKQIVPGLDVTITGIADGYVGNYRVKNVSPVTLPPGSYLVVAQGYNAEELNGNFDLGTPLISGDNGNGAITYTQSSFGPEGVFTYPEIRDGPSVSKYVAGTFLYEIATNGARYAIIESPVAAKSSTTAMKSAIQARVFPNPTRGPLTVQLSTTSAVKATVEVLNTYGAVLQQKSVVIGDKGGSSTVVLDLRQPSGIYLLRVRTAAGVQTFKVNVQR